MSYLKGFFEGPESKPSIRLVCGLLVVLLSCWLELRMVRHSNIEGLIQANFIFVSSLFAITARFAASAPLLS